MDELEAFVTIKDLLKDPRFPIGRNALYKLAERGIIRGRQAGNKWLFLRSEVWEDIQRLGMRRRSYGSASRKRKS